MLNYQELLLKILTHGNRRETRAGPTISIFSEMLKFELRHGFPAVTCKYLPFKSVAGELAGFLRMEEDASKMGSGIWLADAERWGGPGNKHMGRSYGHMWRDWNGTRDQLANVVDKIKHTPTDRRLVVTAWNPSEVPTMILPPCHYAFQFYVDDSRLSCMFHMRSVDCVLGLPFDIASYALLTHIIAQQCKLGVGKLTATLGDTHIYTNHIKVVETKILPRVPLEPPKLGLDSYATIDNFTADMAKLENYSHWGPVKATLNVG
jgi:thymidylate synthase